VRPHASESVHREPGARKVTPLRLFPLMDGEPTKERIYYVNP
jgi:hypothetical protein